MRDVTDRGEAVVGETNCGRALEPPPHELVEQGGGTWFAGPWPEGPLAAAPLSPPPSKLMEQEGGTRLAGTVAAKLLLGRSVAAAHSSLPPPQLVERRGGTWFTGTDSARLYCKPLAHVASNLAPTTKCAES